MPKRVQENHSSHERRRPIIKDLERLKAWTSRRKHSTIGVGPVMLNIHKRIVDNLSTCIMYFWNLPLKLRRQGRGRSGGRIRGGR